MKHVLLNRENVVVDIIDGTIRYLKLQPFGLVVACEEDEGTGVIGSDANTHYTLIKADMKNDPNAVKVMSFETIPSYVKPLEYKWSDGNEEESAGFVDRYTLEEAKILKQEENKVLFAEYLASHPLTWVDGKTYGVTQEDQSEISLNLNQYQLAVAANVEAPTLEWHARHEECKPWSAEQLVALSMAISQAVYPVYHKMQQYKTNIFNATSIEELSILELKYEDEEE